jgi:hypothetical protein
MRVGVAAPVAAPAECVAPGEMAYNVENKAKG